MFFPYRNAEGAERPHPPNKNMSKSDAGRKLKLKMKVCP